MPVAGIQGNNRLQTGLAAGLAFIEYCPAFAKFC